MTKGKLSQKADRRQAQIENALALMGGAVARLEHDSLRVRQAIRRTGLHHLLDIVVEDHLRIADDLRKAQAELKGIWEDGQQSRWK